MANIRKRLKKNSWKYSLIFVHNVLRETLVVNSVLEFFQFWNLEKKNSHILCNHSSPSCRSVKYTNILQWNISFHSEIKIVNLISGSVCSELKKVLCFLSFSDLGIRDKIQGIRILNQEQVCYPLNSCQKFFYSFNVGIPFLLQECWYN